MPFLGVIFSDGPIWSFYVYRCVGFAKYVKYIIYKLQVFNYFKTKTRYFPSKQASASPYSESCLHVYILT